MFEFRLFLFLRYETYALSLHSRVNTLKKKCGEKTNKDEDKLESYQSVASEVQKFQSPKKLQ
jgi:hypothetical protein